MSALTSSSMHDARDAEDIRLLEAGDYRKLVEAYYRVILQRCQARVRNEQDAFDVASEVIVRLLSELKGGKRYDVPYRVVVHKVIGWKIAEHRGRSQPAQLEDDLAVDGNYGVVDDLHDLVAVLERLPKREREVALLRILVGLAPEEIAARLDITRNNVDQAWHRAKGKLREELEAA